MCSINVVINGSFESVKKMSTATKRRGISEAFKPIVNDEFTAWVGYNHLPTTDKSISNCGFETENYIVWLNGYISNHEELAIKYKMELSTKRDTEVLAKFIEKYGYDPNKLQELNGFFAVIYYDKKKELIGGFTDRYGVKQLYIYIDKKGTHYISSEVKGILAVCPNIELDNEAVKDWYYSLGVMTNDTIYKGIKRIPKLEIPEIERSTDTSDKAYKKACNDLAYLFGKTIERNMYDGESGVYLSGGIDSGMIASWSLAKYSFSVDYLDKKYSECKLMKLNSKGVHMSVIINEENAKYYANKTMFALDDLKAGSCYSNFAVAELASKFVRVVYSGAGGDEFFGGYPHRKDKDINKIINRSNCINNLEHWEDIMDSYDDFDNNPEYNISPFEYDLKFLEAVLIVEDRMSGYHTMETRYPFLDNDLVNFALSLPMEFLENKRILKDISKLHPDVIKGKKKGFSNPYFTNDEWMEFAFDKIMKNEKI
jgi:asparagine synthase (glutamine-hydrolysing)